MSDALTIAANGMRSSTDRFALDAAKTVQAASRSNGDDGELTKGITAQIADTAAFKSNAVAFKAADKMRGTLIDLAI